VTAWNQPPLSVGGLLLEFPPGTQIADVLTTLNTPGFTDKTIDPSTVGQFNLAEPQGWRNLFQQGSNGFADPLLLIDRMQPNGCSPQEDSWFSPLCNHTNCCV
jgi:hypothetical protein